MSEKSKLLVIETTDPKEFEIKANELLNENYTLISANVSIINSAEYDFSSLYQAIFVEKDEV